MLADGNSAEAVAHVLEVPLDAVHEWRAQPAVAAPVATASPRPATPSHSFDTELVQAPPASTRAVCLALAVVLAGVGLTFAYQSFRDAHGRVDALVSGALILLVMGTVARMMLGWSRASLVLGLGDIVAPRVLIAERMAYEDVAGYTLVPRTLLPGGNSTFPGNLLSIQSRRPGVPPLTVFLLEQYPVDRRVLSRLDAVARANAAAPLPASAAHRPPRDSGIPGGMPFAGFALIAALCAISFLPMVNDNLRALARTGQSPQRGALRHVEGSVVSADACVSVGRGNDKRSAMRVSVANRSGSTPLDIPCLVPPASLLENGPHQMAIDVDPRSDPPGKVHQVALDGRRLLDDDPVAGSPPGHSRAVSLTLLGIALAAIGVFVAAIVLAWKRMNGRTGPG